MTRRLGGPVGRGFLATALIVATLAAAPATNSYRPHPDRQLVVLERLDDTAPTNLEVHVSAPFSQRRLAAGFAGAQADSTGRVVQANEAIVFGSEGMFRPVAWANGSTVTCDVPSPCRSFESGSFIALALGHRDAGGDEALTNRYYVWAIGENVEIRIVKGADGWRARHVDPTSVLTEVHTYEAVSAGAQQGNSGVDAFIAASHDAASSHTLGIGVPPCMPAGFGSAGAGFWSLFGGSVTDRQVCPADVWAPAAVAEEPTEWLLEGAGVGPTFGPGRYRLVVLDLNEISRQLG